VQPVGFEATTAPVLLLAGPWDEPEGGLDDAESFGGGEVVTGVVKSVLEFDKPLLEELALTAVEGHERSRLAPPTERAVLRGVQRLDLVDA